MSLLKFFLARSAASTRMKTGRANDEHGRAGKGVCNSSLSAVVAVRSAVLSSGGACAAVMAEWLRCIDLNRLILYDLKCR